MDIIELQQRDPYQALCSVDWRTASPLTTAVQNSLQTHSMHFWTTLITSDFLSTTKRIIISYTTSVLHTDSEQWCAYVTYRHQCAKISSNCIHRQDILFSISIRYGQSVCRCTTCYLKSLSSLPASACYLSLSMDCDPIISVAVFCLRYTG